MRLIAALKDFTGPVPAGLFTQKEFFIVTLQRVAATMDDLKREKLRELSDGLAARLARGQFSAADADTFKVSLEKLLGGQDYNSVCSALAGSKELLLERLSRVSPLSVAAEEKKRPGEYRDPAADKLVSEAYARLNFERLEKEAAAGRPVEDLMAQARERAAQYCSINKLPSGLDSTLASPTLSCLDAVTGACFRLLARFKRDNKG